MGNRAPGVLLACFLLIIGLVSFLQSQSKTPRASEGGQQIFTKNCSGCHGLDAKGSVRAPNIATSTHVLRMSATELGTVVSDGIPGGGMPAFRSLGKAEIKMVVDYLRSLQGKDTAVRSPGNAARGKTMFFGEAKCSECHMVSGSGGFIASDLTGYASTRSVEEIRAAIAHRGKSSGSGSAVTVVTAEDQRVEGVLRNEDNFSLQMQTVDGAFHFFAKANLKSIKRNAPSLMPPSEAQRLTPDQLNDLVSYLLTSGTATSAPATEHDPDSE